MSINIGPLCVNYHHYTARQSTLGMTRSSLWNDPIRRSPFQRQSSKCFNRTNRRRKMFVVIFSPLVSTRLADVSLPTRSIQPSSIHQFRFTRLMRMKTMREALSTLILLHCTRDICGSSIERERQRMKKQIIGISPFDNDENNADFFSMREVFVNLSNYWMSKRFFHSPRLFSEFNEGNGVQFVRFEKGNSSNHGWDTDQRSQLKNIQKVSSSPLKLLSSWESYVWEWSFLPDWRARNRYSSLIMFSRGILFSITTSDNSMDKQRRQRLFIVTKSIF